MAPRAALYVAFFGAIAARSGSAQASPTTPDPATLRRSSFTWTQAEIEFGFGHWDAVFPTRPVPRGTRVRPLPAGKPLAALLPGTPGGEELERFIANEKVAGLVVLQDGAVRLERYALGHSASGRWTSQSVAKSVTSTLVGVAIKDGFITSLDDPVTKYVVGLRGSPYDSVTIRQLMTMSSGVKWNETYTDPTSDIARFYVDPVTPGMNATVSYMRKLPREAPPGTKWVYKTGETHLLGVLVAAATGQRLADYLSARIWAPYGMEQAASWSIDRTNDELAGCCLQAALRDYARFGQFVLDGGRIDGRAVVPDGWFEEATRRRFDTTYPDRGYGYQWWTLDGGAFAGFGIHGQLLYIDRSRRMVVVINSAWPVATSPERSATRARFLKVIAAAADGQSGSAANTAPTRRVAITIDDLPTVSRNFQSAADHDRLTRQLVAALRAHRVPAIGFVNEGKLRRGGAVDAAEVELLRQWTRAGLELGNHTYSHLDLHTAPLADYLNDIARGDSVTRTLLAEVHRQPRFFRHPFLHTGRSLADRARVDSLLSATHYRVAPVTIDDGDYIFAAAYDDALGRRDSVEARRIGDAYIDYMERVFAYYEKQAAAITGRDIPQVLLIHASLLNADRFDALARMIERRGYAFVTLEEALADSAYRSADTYVGPAGITWLHRWALTRGVTGGVFAGEPDVPADIAAAADRARR
jgi:CubicO group peptidase (beta-lactamase class C family)/peptidoglycan/xylan/chitin deacetylase (PgdA/CDA1 family)